MADPKKAKVAAGVGSARTAETPPSGKLTVTNTYRNQPVLFHFFGGSMRLGPLETQEVDRDVLASPELGHLVATGVVLVGEPGAGSPPPRGEGAAETTTGEGERRASKPDRPEEK
jgi:hypothetical protein